VGRPRPSYWTLETIEVAPEPAHDAGTIAPEMLVQISARNAPA
jgi:hypothetical protein